MNHVVFICGGKVKQTWDALRQYLGLPNDRGTMSPEGDAALQVHQAQGRADWATREAGSL